MKVLSTLVIIQSLAILLLAVIVSSDYRSTEPVKFVLSEQDATNIAQQIQPQFLQSNNSYALSEDEVRQIIRSELQMLVTNKSVQAGNREKVATQMPEELAAQEEAKDLVSEEIDYYIGAGQITPIEMSKLQEKIARLNAPQRKQMLAKLVAAMNKGQLDGQL